MENFMFQGMSRRFRVVCSHNLNNPDKFFIDISLDGLASHDAIFKMQKIRYKDENLERVCNDGRGIMLREARSDGSIHLMYTQHRDPYAQLAQKRMRAIIDPLIIARFKEMREGEHIQTICEPLFTYNYELQNVCKSKGYAESLQEEEALREVKKQERLKKLKQIRQEFYAKQKYADAPHLRLMLKQAECRGD